MAARILANMKPETSPIAKATETIRCRSADLFKCEAVFLQAGTGQALLT